MVKMEQAHKIVKLVGECGAGKSVEQWCADVERMLPDEALELQHLIPALAPKFASVEAASLYEEATNNDEYLKYVEEEDYAKAWAAFQEVILGDGGFSEDQLMKFVWHGGAKQGFPQYNGAWSHETAEKFAFRWGKLLRLAARRQLTVPDPVTGATMWQGRLREDVRIWLATQKPLMKEEVLKSIKKTADHIKKYYEITPDYSRTTAYLKKKNGQKGMISINAVSTEQQDNKIFC